MEQKYYTYAHIRLDTNEIFYIGKGSGERAWWSKGRNNYWTKIVNKYGYKVEILARWSSEQEAHDHEKILIQSLRDMGYNLVNFTDGGDGIVGYKHTANTKDALSKKAKNAWLNPDFAKKMSVVRRNQWTAEARKKSSDSSKTVWTNENREKHSKKLREAYSSLEMKKMQAEKNRKFRESKEGKIAMSERIKKYWASPLAHTDEAKAKRSEARKKSWETRRAKNADNQ
jgi:hypothetical protein